MNSYENPQLSYECDLTAQRDRLREINADLLVALELMLAKDAAMAERFGARWPLDLAPAHATNAARAAIAKAKGEA